jgi:hypothetical protein
MPHVRRHSARRSAHTSSTRVGSVRELSARLAVACRRPGAAIRRLQLRNVCSAKLFANRSGRVANPFDCADQLIFCHAKMPCPIFYMVLMLDDDFAAVRSDGTDHFFAGPVLFEKHGGVGFVPLETAPANHAFPSNSGNLAILAAIRRASSRFSQLTPIPP